MWSDGAGGAAGIGTCAVVVFGAGAVLVGTVTVFPPEATPATYAASEPKPATEAARTSPVARRTRWCAAYRALVARCVSIGTH
jgi:hypothetical protein